MPGTGLATDPVARTIALDASYTSSPTFTPPLLNAPTPSITSILFFLNRPPTPPVNVLITFSRRAETLLKSISRPATSMPNSSASSISLSTSATRSTALAGMQA